MRVGRRGNREKSVADQPLRDQARGDGRKRARRLNLSVIIPTLNTADTLEDTVAALALADRRGIDLEIVVADGGSADSTRAVAEELGAKVVAAERGRGPQLVAGAKAAQGEWLLFLHADTILERGWDATVMVFVSDDRNRDQAAVFSFALDDDSSAAKRLERIVRFRNNWLGLPYGDQGLLIHRRFYSRLGGYNPLPLMEDVEIIRRIGMARLARFDVKAITSARRYQRSGYIPRILRNFLCLILYFARIPPRWIARLYG